MNSPSHCSQLHSPSLLISSDDRAANLERRSFRIRILDQHKNFREMRSVLCENGLQENSAMSFESILFASDIQTYVCTDWTRLFSFDPHLASVDSRQRYHVTTTVKLWERRQYVWVSFTTLWCKRLDNSFHFHETHSAVQASAELICHCFRTAYTAIKHGI